ncbi:hypothetical protein ACFYW8_31445 [Streptomyces sp. NPDC002742]|uniref:hypothetical protein n=1 Tax=Streptomyces sp. NPDC002742 TaxID=3364663 RepID=UPI003678B8C4
MDAHPPVEVTLPWLRPDGAPVTKRLLFLRTDGNGAVRRTDFNVRYWKPALVAAGAPAAEQRRPRTKGRGQHVRGRRFRGGRPADGPGVVRTAVGPTVIDRGPHVLDHRKRP